MEWFAPSVLGSFPFVTNDQTLPAQCCCCTLSISMRDIVGGDVHQLGDAIANAGGFSKFANVDNAKYRLHFAQTDVMFMPSPPTASTSSSSSSNNNNNNKGGSIAVNTSGGNKVVDVDAYLAFIVKCADKCSFTCLYDECGAIESTKRIKASVDRTAALIDRALPLIKQHKRKSGCNFSVYAPIVGSGNIDERLRAARLVVAKNSSNANDSDGFAFDGYMIIGWGHSSDDLGGLDGVLAVLSPQNKALIRPSCARHQSCFVIAHTFGLSCCRKTPAQIRSLFAAGVVAVHTAFPFIMSSMGFAIVGFPADARVYANGCDAVDLNDRKHKNRATAPVPTCPCYCCSNHSAAYIHHLLMTKEMLGHSLLQIHNIAMFSAFIQSLKQQ